jgi:hypothetical protein
MEEMSAARLRLALAVWRVLDSSFGRFSPSYSWPPYPVVGCGSPKSVALSGPTSSVTRSPRASSLEILPILCRAGQQSGSHAASDWSR